MEGLRGQNLGGLGPTMIEEHFLVSIDNQIRVGEPDFQAKSGRDGVANLREDLRFLACRDRLRPPRGIQKVVR